LVSLGDDVDEYFDVVNVNRPYSLDVGMFNAMVEFNFISSVNLNSKFDEICVCFRNLLPFGIV